MTEQPPSAEKLLSEILGSCGKAGMCRFTRCSCAESIDAFIQDARAEQPDFARCLQCVSHELTRDVCGYAGRCVRQAIATSPSPAVAADYTERAVTVARDAIEGVPDHLLPYRINSEEIAQAIAPHIADALSDRDAAAIRAFGQRVWSDTEEVAYQAGVSDTRAKLQEPDVREAVIEALQQTYFSFAGVQGVDLHREQAAAVIAGIAEKLK